MLYPSPLLLNFFILSRFCFDFIHYYVLQIPNLKFLIVYYLLYLLYFINNDFDRFYFVCRKSFLFCLFQVSRILHYWIKYTYCKSQLYLTTALPHAISHYLFSAEFLWQEGHTAHATADDAVTTTKEILDLYASVCEVCVCMRVCVEGRGECVCMCMCVNCFCRCGCLCFCFHCVNLCRRLFSSAFLVTSLPSPFTPIYSPSLSCSTCYIFAPSFPPFHTFIYFSFIGHVSNAYSQRKEVTL